MAGTDSATGTGSLASAGSLASVIRSASGPGTVNSSSRASGSRSDTSRRSRRMPTWCSWAQVSSDPSGACANTRISSSPGSRAGSS